ncbi:MAG: aldo/keto reductase [Spirochaetaceae bacterium]|jgi:aryl-alcohol dehydrogenase-like predicted oxidoreductase|nr:aldo/keto reductase [Spirochaetaceae bacterium]
MEYVEFGKTGVKVSRLGFGGAVAGLKNYLHAYDPSQDDSKKSVYHALETALELGITYFDTAPGYGDGMSESMFGEVLGSVDPKKFFLATKCPPTDYNGVMRSVETSLKRLRRDYLDLIQIHGNSYSDEEVRQLLGSKGMVEGMVELKKAGVVRFIGFTSEDNNRGLFDLMNSGRFDAVQMCYNILFQHGYEPSRPFGSLFEAEKCKLGIVTMRAPTSGTFQRWMKMIRPDDAFDYTQALIQFVLSNPLVDVALVGMRTADRVRQNVAIVNDHAGRISLDDVHGRYVKE